MCVYLEMITDLDILKIEQAWLKLDEYDDQQFDLCDDLIQY